MTDSAVLQLDRPRIKPIYDLLYLDGRIRLGSGTSYAQEIPDPDGRYAEFVRRLDGTRSVEELRSELAGVLTETELLDGLDVLYQAGYLEDAAVPPPPSLSPTDLQRYAVNLNFFRTMTPPEMSCYQPQATLKDTRVALLGLGGIGSNVCMALAELGVGHIYAVDYDKVELTNLNRQVLYSTGMVGTPKALGAQRRMREFNPDIEFTVRDQRLASLADVEEVLAAADPDFVFCLADKPNGYIDFWVNEACVKRRVPYAAASVSARVGNLYSVLPGVGPCYRCRADSELVEHPEFQEPLNYQRDHELNASNGALGPACMFTAYFLAYELLRCRLDIMGPMLAASRLLEIDFVTFELAWHDFQRQPGCPVCAELPVTAGGRVLG